jgi:DNA-binding PadR family transcriptional regulator
MHGYQIILEIRKRYNTYFGPSTIYPLLNALERKAYVTGAWQLEGGRPRKTYVLTAAGQAQLHSLQTDIAIVLQSVVEPPTRA